MLGRGKTLQKRSVCWQNAELEYTRAIYYKEEQQETMWRWSRFIWLIYQFPPVFWDRQVLTLPNHQRMITSAKEIERAAENLATLVRVGRIYEHDLLQTHWGRHTTTNTSSQVLMISGATRVFMCCGSNQREEFKYCAGIDRLHQKSRWRLFPVFMLALTCLIKIELNRIL